MPKYCSVPNCKNDSGIGNDRKSFYKFPLHDPVRLQQWLKNMGREEWIPSRHQYICHEHFTESCFKIRWGIRYLENDAIPTFFQAVQKRKADDYIEKKPKEFRGNTTLRKNFSDNIEDAAENMELNNLNTLHLYEIVDPSQLEETVSLQVETNDVKVPLESLQTALHSSVSVDEFDVEGTFPVAIFQSIDDLTSLTSELNAEVVVVSEYPATEGQVGLVNGITIPILSEGQKLIMTDSTLGHSEMAKIPLGFEDVTADTEEPSAVAVCSGAEVIAYFETIPSVLPTEIPAQFTTFPDTVLSSALGSKPIASTLPIMSKYMPSSPSSLVLTMERLDPQGEEGVKSEHISIHEQDLEEHSYYKNSWSKEQLEAVVVELQRKVKVLQQRHRRHLEKLLSLENTVSQLKQNNLLNEERLQLLERAYIQTSASMSDGGETVAVFYEEESGAFFFCAPMHDGENKDYVVKVDK